MIEQIAETLASIVGLKSAGALDEAERLVRETTDGLLGPLAGALPGLDAKSVAILLGSAEKLEAYAALVREQGSILHLRGDARGARRAWTRALDLYRALPAPAAGAAPAGRVEGAARERVTEAIRSIERDLASL